MVQCQKQAVYNQRDQCSIDHFRYNDPSQIEKQADPSAKEKLKKIKPGRKITIFVPRKLTQDNKERYRVVKGEIAAIYSKMVHVCVKAGRSAYNECFLKTDLYRWQFNVK